MAAVMVSLYTRGHITTKEVEAKWDKTQDIDNPLNPYVYGFKRLSIIGLVLTKKITTRWPYTVGFYCLETN